MIQYKARREGLKVVYVDPAYTSQTCSKCKHCEKANRRRQSEFVCKSCGLSINADWNAAINIRLRAMSTRPTAEKANVSAISQMQAPTIIALI